MSGTTFLQTKIDDLPCGSSLCHAFESSLLSAGALPDKMSRFPLVMIPKLVFNQEIRWIQWIHDQDHQGWDVAHI